MLQLQTGADSGQCVSECLFYLTETVYLSFLVLIRHLFPFKKKKKIYCCKGIVNSEAHI